MGPPFETYVLGAPMAALPPRRRKTLIVLIAFGGSVPAFAILFWIVDADWSIAGILPAMVGGMAWTLWSTLKRMPSPLSADRVALRLGFPVAVIELPWEALEEVRVSRGRVGHRVIAVPVDIETALAQLPDEFIYGSLRRELRQKACVSISVGHTRFDTDRIVAVLTYLANGRCRIGSDHPPLPQTPHRRTTPLGTCAPPDVRL